MAKKKKKLGGGHQLPHINQTRPLLSQVAPNSWTKSRKGRKQQKQTSISRLQTGLKWATEAHLADVPAVSIRRTRLHLLFSFLSDELGGSTRHPKTTNPIHSCPCVSTYLSFLFCPFCFPAKLLNSSSVGCWYQRRLSTQRSRCGKRGHKKKKMN